MELAEFFELVTDLNQGIARIEMFQTTTTENQYHNDDQEHHDCLWGREHCVATSFERV